MASITEAMQRAAKRRLPLVVAVLPKDGTDQASDDLRLSSIRAACVLHRVTEGSQEFVNFAAVSGPQTTMPRCHVFPPQSRQLPPLVLSGDALNDGSLRESVLRAAAFTAAELKEAGSPAQTKQLESAFAELARKYPVSTAARTPASSGTSAAARDSSATAPAASAPKPAAPAPAPKPSAAPAVASEQPRPTSAAAGMKIHIVGGTHDDFVTVGSIRKNTSMTMLRRLVGKAIGHENFVILDSRGNSLSSTQQERSIVADILGPTGYPTIKINAAQAAIEEATLRKSQDRAADGEHALEPSASKGPRAEPEVTVRIFDGSTVLLVHTGQPSQPATAVWAALASKTGIAEDDLRIRGARHGSDDDDDDDGVPVVLTRDTMSRGLVLSKLTQFARLELMRAPPPQPAAAAAAAAAPGVVRVRLQYPGPSEQPPIIECLPSDTLSVLHDRARDDLQTEHFSLVQAYPVKRFSAEDLAQSFEALSISGSVAIRVVPSDGPASPPKAPSGHTVVGDVSGAVAGAASGVARFVGGFWGRGQQQNPAPAGGQPEAAGQPAPQQPPQQRGGAHSLGDIARREAEEKDKKKGGNNTYFGGDSTAYEGK